MIHPIPPGTRDVLPDEMRELRRLEAALREVFERFGYAEVATPAIEYDEVLELGEERGAGVAYRFFDEQGKLLALRSDMTIPIARLVSGRYAASEPPLRFSYVAHTYRAVRPQRGQQREFVQAGIELLGVEAPEGTAEVVEVLCAALEAVGLPRARVGLGDADLYRQLLKDVGASAEAAQSIMQALTEHDFVGIERAVAEAEGLDDRAREILVRLPQIRGGGEALEEARELGGEAVERATRRLRATYESLASRGVADRVILDLGLLRELGYYTGAILEVYDPALGHILGGGGRYDELLGRFGRPLPAAGFALYLERLHVAQLEEDRQVSGGMGHIQTPFAQALSAADDPSAPTYRPVSGKPSTGRTRDEVDEG